MHAVAAQFGGKVGPVVHNERNAFPLCDRLQDARGAAHRVVIDILQAQLQAGGIAAFQRRFELAGEFVRIESGRRDQVKPRRRPRFIGLERLNWSVLLLTARARRLALITP
jgi:hypothetical protein